MQISVGYSLIISLMCRRELQSEICITLYKFARIDIFKHRQSLRTNHSPDTHTLSLFISLRVCACVCVKLSEYRSMSGVQFLLQCLSSVLHQLQVILRKFCNFTSFLCKICIERWNDDKDLQDPYCLSLFRKCACKMYIKTAGHMLE